jgi:DNA-binding response OmpR family regulator
VLLKMDERILIIDDEHDTTSLLRRALMAHNYSVNEAENLRKGLDLYSNVNPDIVVLDVNLPDENGLQYANHFKRNENIVILISADNDQLTNSYRDFGVDGFLRKPFTPNDLLAMIHKVKEETRASKNS